jgi:hypothetical protein
MTGNTRGCLIVLLLVVVLGLLVVHQSRTSVRLELLHPLSLSIRGMVNLTCSNLRRVP